MQQFAVIFDFNGTMLFDTPLQYQAWNMLAEKTMGAALALTSFCARPMEDPAQRLSIFSGEIP